MSENRLSVYPMPPGIPLLKDFRVRVRPADQEQPGEWKEADTCLARVDMHHVREASVAWFDFQGKAECEVISLSEPVKSVEIRPRSAAVAFRQEENRIRFCLDKPAMLSVEINGDRFHNLHLFAGRLPEEEERQGTLIEAGGEVLELEKEIEKAAWKDGRKVVYLGPGLHRLAEDCCRLPSDTTVILDGGAVVMGSFLVHHQKNVSILGRGMIYLGHVKRETYLRGADVNYSENVVIQGVTVMNPAHYGIHLGCSRNVMIRDIRIFSCVGWSDGIDMMASENILVENVFLRNSDDCIAVYGGRFQYPGDTRNVVIRHAVLWADVAHPTMIGVHGDADRGGSTLENISFEDVDILEHHEPQDDYLGCMAINVGDDNTVRNVSYQDIRVEQFERGKLLDIQIKWNRKYNDVPGKRVENIRFENIDYTGTGEYTSEIRGFGEDRKVQGILIKNMTVRGVHVLKPEDGNLHIGEYAEDVKFE